MIVELNLTIERKWLDMIAKGEKKEEYRDYGHRQVQRAYLEAFNSSSWGWDRDPVAIFRNGYRMDSRALVAEIVGMTLRGAYEAKHLEWGEPWGRRSYFAIMLGEVLKSGTYAEVKEYIMAVHHGDASSPRTRGRTS